MYSIWNILKYLVGGFKPWNFIFFSIILIGNKNESSFPSDELSRLGWLFRSICVIQNGPEGGGLASRMTLLGLRCVARLLGEFGMLISIFFEHLNLIWFGKPCFLLPYRRCGYVGRTCISMYIYIMYNVHIFYTNDQTGYAGYPMLAVIQ